MDNQVLFDMYEPFRRSLIDTHMFYVEQARNGLLAQFKNLESEADAYETSYLEASSQGFDPDKHDPADCYETAFQQSVNFYILLCNMRDQTILSVVAGMYHQWDKQFREWLTKEALHWTDSQEFLKQIWSAPHKGLVDP